jgi:hypothetical protein
LSRGVPALRRKHPALWIIKPTRKQEKEPGKNESYYLKDNFIK